MNDPTAAAREIQRLMHQCDPCDVPSEQAIAAILRKHFQPASGDGELDRAVDESWLRSVGFEHCDEMCAHYVFVEVIRDDEQKLMPLCHDDDGGWTYGDYWLPEMKTRRDALALMQALGIQSPNQPASGKGG